MMFMGTKDVRCLNIDDVLARKPLSHIGNAIVMFDQFNVHDLPIEPHRCQCVLVALCLEGTIHYVADTVEYEVPAGYAMIVSEGQVVNARPTDCYGHGIAIMISYDFFNEIVKEVHEMSALFLFSRIHPVCRLLPDEVKGVCRYFSLIKEKVDDAGNFFHKDVVRMLLSAMIYDLYNAIYRIQMSSSQKQSSAETIFMKFVRLVELHYRHERRVGWYARELCISAKYLSETVKQVSHRTPNEWIDNYVLKELRVQLRNTSKSIKEISNELHFTNQSFMGKFFKEHVGVSPLTYRKG